MISGEIAVIANIKGEFWRRSLRLVSLPKPSDPIGRFDKKFGMFLEIEERRRYYLRYDPYISLQVSISSCSNKYVMRIILKSRYFQENALLCSVLFS